MNNRIIKQYSTIIARMTKCLFLCLLFLLSCTIMTGCTTKEEITQKQMNYEFYYLADYWNAYDLSHSALPTQESFEALTAQYIPKIEALLGIYDWWAETVPNADTIGINMQAGNGGSWAYSPYKISEKTVEITIILDLDSLQKRYGLDAALAHELTHTIAGASFSQSLEEGLCDYVQTQVGTNPYRTQTEWNKCEIIKLNMNMLQEKDIVSKEKLSEIKNHIGAAEGGCPYGISTRNGRLWYHYSETFVTYLIDTYGMEKTVALIREGTDEDSYETYFGESFEEVKSDWTAWFDALEPSMTVEEIVEVEKAYMAQFGYSSLVSL